MLVFLQSYAPVVSAIASLGTLLIWAIYLHIFVGGHLRQIKPMLVINRGEGRTLGASCLVTNMSREPVHIQSVVATVTTQEMTYNAYITDAEDIRGSGRTSDWQRLTRQGPLQPGTMVDMGTFGCILDFAARSWSNEPAFIDSHFGELATGVEITVLGIYGSEDLLIGASRSFEIDRSKSEIELRAVTALTRQLTAKKERKRLLHAIEEQL
ncbi:hypothetical protein [Agrobacterium sp. lyk4-40-TYG-31]|uniref:hypothetical protein n=1 Tax=Agrobacterium sp. lyk4-40-TYG-31 TaxID=3040276 RepID=UPI000DD8C221|nr:hypothetical protein [Agrobacterium sp. lyk4-40-TYG-31]